MAIHPEVFLAAGYAIFLICVSLGLDSLARHSHTRSERYRTTGFTYHHSNYAWICLEDQLLLRSEVDHRRGLIRYRGRPQICNSCPTKPDCTDSDEGREVVHAIDPWPYSEAGRFHRGISLAVVLIAGLILAAETLRNHSPLELAVLGVVFLAVVLTAWHLHAVFRASPSNFPTPAPPSQVHPERARLGYSKAKGTGHPAV